MEKIKDKIIALAEFIMYINEYGDSETEKASRETAEMIIDILENDEE